MANTFTTPNMKLPSPVPGAEAGPQWATDNFNCLSIIDAHTHAAGSGVQITPLGININLDLSFNSFNAISLRSARFAPQGSPIPASGSDIGCLYEAGSDLYFNDGAGNQVRITQGGNVAGASGTITGLPSGTASAAFASSSGSFIFQQATSTGANLDVGSIAIRYPGSYPTPSGNYIQLQAPSSLASGYSITLPGLPLAGGTFVTMDTDGSLHAILNANPSQFTFSGTIMSIAAGGVGTTQLADAAVTTAKLGVGAVTALNITDHCITGGQIVGQIDMPGTSVRAGGLNVVCSSTNTSNGLTVIRGLVNSSGGITAGEGFSVSRASAGVYNITFTTSFAGTAVVIATVFGTVFSLTATCSAASSSGCTIRTFNPASGAAIDEAFSFIAIASRV